MAPHSSTLAWKLPWMEEPGRLQSMGPEESDMTERLHFHFSLSRIGEGNANPLQRSCLENPRDRGAWWAAVYGVAQSRTLLKQLSSSSSRFVIVFLPRSTHLLISCLQSSFAVILKPKKIKSALHKPKCEWFLLFWRCKVSTWTIQSQQWGFLGDTSSKV